MHPNKTLIYKAYTAYEPVPGRHLVVESRPFDDQAAPPPQGFTLKNLYLSLDPYQRGQMRKPGDEGSYSIPWVENEPAVVMTLSLVLKSDNAAFAPGAIVSAMAAAGEYAAVPAEWAAQARVLPPPTPGVAQVEPSALVGALGVAGLSAYVSFFEFVPEPRKGKTMLVSAASGGVGQLVGQLGKLHGMKVIGSTGSQEKVDFVVKELGFDAAWNYKQEKTADAIHRLAPEGLDVYYDNVGGEQLETALTLMKDFGHIVSSGAVSVYNLPDEEKYGVRTLMNMFLKRLTMRGFVCSDANLIEKYMPTFGSNMLRWMAEGKVKTKEEVLIGVDSAPEAMIRMFRGDKFGKMVIKVSEEQEM